MSSKQANKEKKKMRKIMLMTSSILATVLAVWFLAAPFALGATGVISPINVPGKEYSNNPDETAGGAFDPLQNIAWDGTGNAWDTFDYSGSAGNNYRPSDNDQVDALANIQDLYYWEVVDDKVPLLTSFQADGNIYYQTAGVDTTNTWANPATINATAPPADVDGLEVWGPKVYPADTGGPGIGDDANMFSLIGDPGGTSVFYYNPIAHTVSPYITRAQIAGAIGAEGPVDLDAMMVFDQEKDDYFAPGDSIMFSINAVGPYDGGEVWVWTLGKPAAFLTHGGEAWNTAHKVGADFRVQTEEINALEAVIPEPGTLLLLGSGLLGLAGYARKRSIV